MKDHIIGAFLGTLGGLIVALLIERLKKPSLVISASAPSDQSPGNLPARFLHITVKNRPLPRFIRHWLTREVAQSAYGRIRFFHPDGKEALPRPMDIRWTGSPQPPEFEKDRHIIYASVFDILRFRDLHPNRAEGIDVCVKFEGEVECYGFTNMSYMHELRHPDYRLPSGIYTIEVSIFCGDLEWSKRFTLRNDWPRKDFALETK